MINTNMKRVQREQIFRGFSSFDHNKKVIYDLELIKRDLINHFYTRKGERVMFPNFGSIIWDMLFDPLTEEAIETIKEDVEFIINSDSRVQLEGLIVDVFEHGIVIQASILYRPFEVVEDFTLAFDRRTAPASTF